MKAEPRAAPSGTAATSTGRPVESASACIHAATWVPPRWRRCAGVRGRPPGQVEVVADHEPARLVGGPQQVGGGGGGDAVERGPQVAPVQRRPLAAQVGQPDRQVAGPAASSRPTRRGPEPAADRVEEQAAGVAGPPMSDIPARCAGWSTAPAPRPSRSRTPQVMRVVPHRTRTSPAGRRPPPAARPGRRWSRRRRARPAAGRPSSTVPAGSTPARSPAAGRAWRRPRRPGPRPSR